MKYYRIHHGGHAIILLIAGITIETGNVRLYTNRPDRLQKRLCDFFDMSDLHQTWNEDKQWGYVALDPNIFSIDEVHVESVLPPIF